MLAQFSLVSLPSSWLTRPAVVIAFIWSIASRIRFRMPSSWNRSCRVRSAFSFTCRSSWSVSSSGWLK